MSILRILSFVIWTITLVACAEVPKDAPRYQRATAADQNNANVYIYRINAYPKKRIPNIIVDERPIFEPPEGSYTTLQLEEGTHQVAIDWSWDVGNSTRFPIRVQKGVPIYIKITGVFFAKVLSQQEAEAEIQKCCQFIPVKIIK